MTDPTVTFLSEALMGLKILTDLPTIAQLDIDLTKDGDFTPLRDRVSGIRRAFEALDSLAYKTPPARGSILYDGHKYVLTVTRLTPTGQAVTVTVKGRFLEGASQMRMSDEDRLAHPTVSGRSSGAGMYNPKSNVPW